MTIEPMFGYNSDNLEERHRRYLADPEPTKARVKRWQQENTERLNAYRRARRLEPEVKRRERAGHLMRKYGITLEAYDAMVYLRVHPHAEEIELARERAFSLVGAGRRGGGL